MTGPIALHGGGEYLAGDDRTIAALLDLVPDTGRPIRIAVVPTAAARGRPDLAGGNGVAAFRRVAGAADRAADAEIVSVVDAASAADASLAGRLRDADVIAFPGGDPDLIPTLLAGSPAWAAITDAWERGAVLAGASAGAMALGPWTWTPGGGVPGLGLVPGRGRRAARGRPIVAGHRPALGCGPARGPPRSRPRRAHGRDHRPGSTVAGRRGGPGPLAAIRDPAGCPARRRRRRRVHALDAPDGTMRHDRGWALDPAITFLNHGSFGACPPAVLEVQRAWRDRLEAQPVRFLDRDLDELMDHARGVLGAFLGADPDGLAFVPNATTGANAVLHSLRFEPGDELLTDDHEYNAILTTMRAVAARDRAELVIAPLPYPTAGADELAEAFLARVTPRTRLAVVSHVTSPTALILPVERLVSELAARGVDTLVDGAHAPGMLPLSLDALGAAYYTGNGHKWLCGPKGSAFLWVRADRRSTVHPTVVSHGANDPRLDRPRFRLEFDWVGTTDPTAALTLPAALDWMAGQEPGGWPAVMAAESRAGARGPRSGRGGPRRRAAGTGRSPRVDGDPATARRHDQRGGRRTPRRPRRRGRHRGPDHRLARPRCPARHRATRRRSCSSGSPPSAITSRGTTTGWPRRCDGGSSTRRSPRGTGSAPARSAWAAPVRRRAPAAPRRSH